ncbi:MAG TPA: tlde1 domain-containing protein [Caulobacteraceae bacterium]|nr:tlde1 domain-containing protein [Caulobacteraceae bacterium]
MSWSYSQATGKLRDPSGEWVGTGYSGHGAGLNNPAMEADPDVGPIPAGIWIIGPPRNPPDHLGPLAMPLEPIPGFDPHGRSGFFMHGDFVGDTGEAASKGCIVIQRADRQLVAASADRRLLVTA